MPDDKMTPASGESNIAFPDYENMRLGRTRFGALWLQWLLTNPSEQLVTAELMYTQALLRRWHDDVTGRRILQTGDAE